MEAIETKEEIGNNIISKKENTCSIAFEKTINNLNSEASFEPLLNFYKNHSECMDGAYSQGIEGAISKALDENWSELNSLSDLFILNSGFKAYFFKNIGCDVSATESHLRAVSTKAKKSCPSQLKKLCSEILLASDKALKYSESQ